MTLQDAREGGVHKARSNLSGNECCVWRGRMAGIIAIQEQAVQEELVLGQGGRVLATEQGLKYLNCVVALLSMEDLQR